jgi:hypothetical protein
MEEALRLCALIFTACGGPPAVQRAFSRMLDKERSIQKWEFEIPLPDFGEGLGEGFLV